MARRSLSTRGRIVAAGTCVAIGGSLAGFMAAGDHTANASSTNSSSASANATVDGNGGSSATPSIGSNDGSVGFPSGDTGFQPQPQTRTGGS